MIKSGLIGICAVLLGLCAAPARADILVLRDGRTFDAFELQRVEAGVEVKLENGTLLVPEEMVEEALIEGVSTYVPRTDEEKQRYAEGLVRYQGRWMSPQRRSQLIERRVEERRKELEEELAHSSWATRYQEKSKRFDYEFTVPRHVFDEYRDQLEAYFDLFAKDWRVKIKKHGRNTGRLCVNFYGNRKQFIRTGGAGPWVLGYFKFVGEIYDLNIYYDRTDPEGTRDVMFHEVNHYLQKLIDQGFRYPHWPGESLAEYYGAGYWDPERKELVVGQVQEGRLTEILGDIAGGERLGLEELITKDRYEDYTWGWSLVHFLMNDGRHAKNFKKFFLGLASARDIDRTKWTMGTVNLETVEPHEVWRAFRAYMGLKTDEDVETLEKEWHDYVESTLRIESTRGKELAAVKSWRSEGRDIRAERLFREAIEEGSRNPVTFYHLANLLYGKGKREEALELWRKAAELDPLGAEFHYSLGFGLRKKEPQEAERLMALAKELDPDVEDRAYVKTVN